MEEVINNLRQWIVRFLKNKDLVFKRIKGIEEDSNLVTVDLGDKKRKLFIAPVLNEKFDLSKVKQGDKGIVTINNRKNLDFVVKNWKSLIENEQLIIYFVNPFSKIDKKWIVFPHTHNKVTEGQKINEGLTVLFKNVDPISIEEYKEIVKG